jgi:hypothetical protein
MHACVVRARALVLHLYQHNNKQYTADQALTVAAIPNTVTSLQRLI